MGAEGTMSVCAVNGKEGGLDMTSLIRIANGVC